MIKFLTSFENIRKSNSGSGTSGNIGIKGYFDFANTAVTLRCASDEYSPDNSTKSATQSDYQYRSSYVYAVNNATYDTFFHLVDTADKASNKLVIGASLRSEYFTGANATKEMISFRDSTDATHRIGAGLNGEFWAIYVNGTVAATSTVNGLHRNPFSYVELFIDKVNSKVWMRVNGKAAADTSLPAGWDFNMVGFTFQNNGSYITDFYYSIDSDPYGPMFIKNFNNFAINRAKQFSGDINTTNTAPFSPTTYAQSDVNGAEDSFKHVSPIDGYTGYAWTEVVALSHNILASSGNGNQPLLSAVLEYKDGGIDQREVTDIAARGPIGQAPTWFQDIKERSFTTEQLNSLCSGYANI